MLLTRPGRLNSSYLVVQHEDFVEVQHRRLKISRRFVEVVARDGRRGSRRGAILSAGPRNPATRARDFKAPSSPLFVRHEKLSFAVRPRAFRRGVPLLASSIEAHIRVRRRTGALKKNLAPPPNLV
jgi:hypothetical protein